MASIPALDRRRRELAADLAKATRRHARRAALARNLVRATCDVLRAEVRAARQARTVVEDLFTRLGVPT